MFAVIRGYCGQSNVLTIPRVFIKITKSHRAALVLSQCIYWSDKSHLTDGWFYKSYKEWRQELEIPQRGMMTAIDILKKKGLLETKIVKINGAPTCHYRVDIDMVFTTITTNPDYAETV